MVKYRLVRPDVKKAERHEEREAESSHSTKRRIRGPISLYKDTVESYRAKKESVSNYYQNMVDEQKPTMIMVMTGRFRSSTKETVNLSKSF